MKPEQPFSDKNSRQNHRVLLLASMPQRKPKLRFQQPSILEVMKLLKKEMNSKVFFTTLWMPRKKTKGLSKAGERMTMM